MKEWWDRKKKKTRRARKTKDKYTSSDFIADVLLWAPELLFFPFRMLFWFFRAVVKSIFNLFDIV